MSDGTSTATELMTMRIPVESAKAIRQFAEKNGLVRNDVLRMAIDEWLSNNLGYVNGEIVPALEPERRTDGVYLIPRTINRYVNARDGEHRIGVYEQSAYAVLCDYAYHNGYCRVSYATIASEGGMARDRAIAAVKALIHFGLVEMVRRGGWHTPPVYRVKDLAEGYSLDTAEVSVNQEDTPNE